MKMIKTFCFLAFAGMMAMSCKDSASTIEVEPAAETSAVASADAKMETATFDIAGMSCAVGCAKTIEKKLSATDGVQNATVNYENKTATVAFDASIQSPEKLVEVVEAAADGKTYKVSNLKSSGDKAMLYIGDKDKEKKKKKKKKKGASEADKAGCATDAKPSGKPGCCAAKKAACSMEKSTL